MTRTDIKSVLILHFRVIGPVICHGFDDESGINKEIKKWANITIPLAKEWNAECLYWYGDNRPEMTGWLLNHF
jgi:hypothetical protein